MNERRISSPWLSLIMTKMKIVTGTMVPRTPAPRNKRRIKERWEENAT